MAVGVLMRIIAFILLFSICTQAQIMMNMDRSKLFNPVSGGGSGALSTPVLVASDSTGNKIKLSLTNVSGADSIYYYYRMADSMYNPVWYHQWTKIVRPVSDSIYYFTNVPNGWALRFYAETKNTTDTSSVSNIDTARTIRSTGMGITRYISTAGTGTWAACTTAGNSASYETFVTNKNDISEGDTIRFNRGEVWSPASGGGTNALIEPTGDWLGTYLNPIVFATYGTGAMPEISSENQTGKVSIRTDGCRMTHVYFQDIYFKNSMELWAYQGANVGVKVLRCRVRRSYGFSWGINFFANPTTFTNTPTWRWGFEGDGSHDSVEVAYCQVDSSYYDGIFFSTNSDSVKGNAWIHHNDIYRSGEDGIDMQGSHHLVEYNIIYNYGQTGYKNMPHYNGAYHSTFRYNIVIGEGSGSNSTFPSNDSTLHHNNTLDSTGFAGFWGTYETLAPPTKLKGQKCIFANNIARGAIYGHTCSTMGHRHRDGSIDVVDAPNAIHVDNYFYNNMLSGGFLGVNFGVDPTDSAIASTAGNPIIDYTFNTTTAGYETQVEDVTALNAADKSADNTTTVPTYEATGYPTTYIDRAAIILHYAPATGSAQLNAGYNMYDASYIPPSIDIAGNEIPTTGNITIGAVQNEIP
jgi:hypothetical protein